MPRREEGAVSLVERREHGGVGVEPAREQGMALRPAVFRRCEVEGGSEGGDEHLHPAHEEVPRNQLVRRDRVHAQHENHRVERA